VEQLIRQRELEHVTGAAADGAPLLTQARKTAATAGGLVQADAYSAYVLAAAMPSTVCASVHAFPEIWKLAWPFRKLGGQ
jgi:hypothetical protein